MKLLKTTDFIVGILLGIQIIAWIYTIWYSETGESFNVIVICLNIMLVNITYWRSSHNTEDYKSEINLKIMNRVNKFRIITVVFTFILVFTFCFQTLHYIKIDKQIIIDWFSKVIFIYIIWMGNYMYNIKENGTLGAINSYTDNNEIIWKKATNLKSRIMFYGGIICLLLVIIVPTSFTWLAGKPVLSVCILLLLVIMYLLVPLWYSQILSKKFIQKNLAEL